MDQKISKKVCTIKKSKFHEKWDLNIRKSTKIGTKTAENPTDCASNPLRTFKNNGRRDKK